MTPILTLVRQAIYAEPDATFKALVNAVIDRIKVERDAPESLKETKETVVLVLTLEKMRGALEDALSKSGGSTYVPKVTGADGWVTPAGRVSGLGSLLPTVPDDAEPDDYDVEYGPSAMVTRRSGKSKVAAPVAAGPELVGDFLCWLEKNASTVTQKYAAVGPLGLMDTGSGFLWHLKVVRRAAKRAAKEAA